MTREELEYLANIRISTIGISLKMVPLLLDKLEEHPNNLQTALENVDKASACLSRLRSDLQNYTRGV